MNPATHIPVLRDRVVSLVAPTIEYARAVVIDATVGLGGHAEALLSTFPHLHLIGIDRDPDALDAAHTRLQCFEGRIELVSARYDELAHILGGRPASAVLFDFGVSSMQLDQVSRGFSYAHDAPLDMRMNPADSRTAADVIADESAESLAAIFAQYGQEKFARRIARTIVKRRESEPFTHSSQLVAAVRDSVPAAARRTGGNPAKRTFQALRIAVNDELAGLEAALPPALDSIAVRGRVIAMSYHSGEDRIVKNAFTTRVTAQVPRDVPVVPEALRPAFTLVTRGAERADQEEVDANPRAKSVRLRAIERSGS